MIRLPATICLRGLKWDVSVAGSPADITHIDIPSTGIIQWEKYDISQSYVNLSDYSLGNYTVVMANP